MNEAIRNQILLQIQATLKSGQGHIPETRWDKPARRPECRSEKALDRRFRSDFRDECYKFPNRNEDMTSEAKIFWWPDMKQVIDNKVKDCTACLASGENLKPQISKNHYGKLKNLPNLVKIDKLILS